MRFHAILCTRDEDDVIGESLRGMLQWADAIHVFDSGSVDTTWEIVQQISKEDSRVRPIERRPIWFSDNVRGYVFDLVRREMEDGDWLLRVDTDEFYHIHPPDFVNEYLRPYESCVYHQYFDFKLTQSELLRLSTLDKIEAERRLPIEERRQFFIPSEYSEPRMCRYRRRSVWPSNFTFPKNAGLVAENRIPIRHYPNRDPLQMAKRILLRQTMTEASQTQGLYTQRHPWRERDWRSLVVPDSDPRLQVWRPGMELPNPGNRNHLAGGLKRFLQLGLYRFGVRIVDRLESARAHPKLDLKLMDDSIQRTVSERLHNSDLLDQ